MPENTSRRVVSTDYDALWSASWGDLQKYGPVSRHQRRILAALLDPIQHEIRSVLDVGCGQGVALAFLAHRYQGKDVAGIDISQKAIQTAKRVCPSAFLQAGTLVDMKAGKFDAVISMDVLEHVCDDMTLLQQMAERANKYVICSTVQGRMRPSEEGIGHLRNYAYGELAAKMTACGLEPIRVIEWGFPFLLTRV